MATINKAPQASTYTTPAYTPDRATQTLREYDSRMGTSVQVPREDTQTPSNLATQGILEGLERDRQAAQEADALKSEVRSELGSTMTRMANEPVLETLRATPIVNYVVPSYTPSSATPYASSSAGPSTAEGVPFGLEPGAGAPTGSAAPTERDRQLAMLDQIYAQYQGMRGAPVVGMNKDIVQGIAGQQAAMRDVMGAMTAEVPGQEAARAGQMATGQQYIEGLQKLRGEQAQLFGARRQAMAEDEARMAQAEKSFDASRVIREVGKSPLSTGALSFAAGLVGALKGQAGDMSPNQILGEVDKAIERDVLNQQTEYSRMKDGIAGRRTNFLDAVKMGASETEALAASTLASMDQHKRALEFAEQRISGAKEKGAIKQAISQLDVQRGKMKMDLDLKNAANYVAMNKSRLAGMEGVVQARAKLMGMDPEARQKAAGEAFKFMDKGFDEAVRTGAAVGRVRALMTSMPIQKQREVWDMSIGRIIKEAAESAEAKGAKDGASVLAMIGKSIKAQMSASYSPEQVQMMNLAQKIVNEELRNISGGSVTDGEFVRNLMSRDFSNYDKFKNWMDTQQSEARNSMNKYKVLSRGSDPNVSTLLENAMLPGTAELDAYDQWEQSQNYYSKGAKK